VTLDAAANPLTGLVRALRDRLRGLLREIGKFGVVGAGCYALDIALFNLMLLTGVEPITAKIISTVISTTAAFVGHRYWTWRDRERSGLPREYGLFFGINLVGLGIGLACLWFTHYVLGGIWPFFTTALADNLSANLVGVGLATLFRFWAYRRYVFRAPAGPASVPAPATEPGY
jgi:putative flippase GtrA